MEKNKETAACVHEGAYDDLPETYRRIMAYIKRKKLSVAWNACEQTLVGWHSCKREEDLRTLVMIGVS